MHGQLNEILKGVSRSFYLTLRVLPRSVRDQIGLAYLLARTSDTIADCAPVAISERIAALQSFRECIRTGAKDPHLAKFFPTLTAFQGTCTDVGSPGNSELVLLARCPEFLETLNRFPALEQDLIRQTIDTIISGQTLDLERFGNASVDNVLSLESEAELDDYTYRVAGCVGVFWTKLCAARVFDNKQVDVDQLVSLGVRFGKGLQLINILRDVAQDIRNGRCYIPRERLLRCGLEPVQLLNPGVMQAFGSVYNYYLDLATDFLTDGWTYTNMLPLSQVRLRLACAWPILIGLRTVSLLRKSNVLDPKLHVKVSRSEVRKLIVASVRCYPFRGSWEKLFRKAQV